MKLISLSIVVYMVTGLGAQKYEDEQFFLPHYQPGSGAFASDSSLYLPPEPHTAIPYYAMKATNKLPFQYLPPTGTKAPASFPTPFPVILSSSMVPIFDDDDEPKNKNDRPVSSPQPSPQQKRFNNTQRSNIKEPEKREMRQMPRTANYEQPIDRIDVKPAHFTMNAGPISNPPVSQTPASRRTIPILTVDSMGSIRSDGGEMMKAGSYPSHQYIHAPGVFISSSTTEPAIPIIRLSNEMDLDGSFSYEALGADQTHYVQHSRMENVGSDKEEQVVEGSYSYVGDNGQTYTVHYIADSNGFRATGDHLPVAPPMPEIIQRAVQYNLAEEAKRPPHLKSWQEDEKSYDLEAEKIQRFPSSPPRNLFTGKTPEAFSYSFSPGNTQNNQNNQLNQNSQNNIATAASSLQSVKTVDFTKDQTGQVKLNNGPISPQITFLASQGAHVPSMNSPQQSIARIFTTEKSSMPQLMNYEAVIKDADQESNKALWRWQYGINSNSANQNKNTISRSSGDEVMINFSEMTPEQYTSMIQSQLEPNIRSNVHQMQYADHQANVYNKYNNYDSKTQQYQKLNTSENIESPIENEYQHVISNNNYDSQNQAMNHNYVLPKMHAYQNQNSYTNINDNQQINQDGNNQYYSNDVSPAPPAPVTTQQIARAHDYWYKSVDEKKQPTIEQAIEQVDNPEVVPAYHRSKLITHHDFIPPSQTVTKSYDYEESFYESRKIYDVAKDIKFIPANSSPPIYFSTSTIQNIDSEIIRTSTTEQPPTTTTTNDAGIRFVDFIKPDDTKSQSSTSSEASIKFVDFIKTDDSKFRPVTNKNIEEKKEEKITTTQASMEQILENNIFLKNLVRTEKKENHSNNHIEMEQNMNYHKNLNAEPKVEKIPKYIQYQTQMMNDIKGYRKKTADLSEILNFVAQKNHFESSKVQPKHKPINSGNLNQSNRMIYIPTPQKEDDDEEDKRTNTNNYRTLNHQQQEELRGIIKNYKVLQRNNNNIRNEEEKINQLRRDLSPPPLKMLHSPNLPPLGRAGPSMKSYLPPIFI